VEESLARVSAYNSEQNINLAEEAIERYKRVKIAQQSPLNPIGIFVRSGDEIVVKNA